MSIIEQIEALNYAYLLAREENFSDAHCEVVIELVHECCKVDADDTVELEDYLLVSAEKLTKLYTDVRKWICREINYGDILSDYAVEKLARLFELKKTYKVRYTE